VNPPSKAEAPASHDELSPAAKIALEFFGCAKSEVHVRIRMRDTLLAAYAAGAYTAIATVLSSAQLGEKFLYGIPYLALAFSLLVSYHHAGIGALGSHCATDLFPTLAREGRVLGFEYSNVFHHYHKKNSTRRALAHVMILLFPAGIALGINWRDVLPSIYALTPHLTVLWLLGAVMMILSAAVIYRSNRSHYEGFVHDGFPTTTILDAIERRA
jgi:hypothetical protein